MSVIKLSDCESLITEVAKRLWLKSGKRAPLKTVQLWSRRAASTFFEHYTGPSGPHLQAHLKNFMRRVVVAELRQEPEHFKNFWDLLTPTIVMETLSKRQQTIVMLRYGDGFGHLDIAEALGVEPSVVSNEWAGMVEALRAKAFELGVSDGD